MNLLKKIKRKYSKLNVAVKASIWFFICSVIQKCLSFITTPIFTRLLSLEQYSQYSIYVSWLQIFQMITTLRLNYGVFNKGMSKFGKNRDEYTLTMQTITSILTLIVFAFYMLFSNYVNRLTGLSTFVTCGMFIELFFTPAITFWTLRERYDYRYKRLIIVTLGISFMNMITGIIGVLLFKEKGLIRIFSCIFTQFIFGLYIYIVNIKRGKIFFNKYFAKFALLFNLPLIPHFLSTYILSQSDRIMIQWLDSAKSVALYSVIYNAAMIVQIVTESINSSLIPSEYRALESKTHKIFGFKLNFVILMLSLFLIFTMLIAPEFVSVLAGNKYAQAVFMMPPVIASVFFIFLFQLFCNVEFFFEKNKITMFISMIGALLNLVLNYFFIPRFGYVAASYSTLFCYVIFALSHYVYICILLKKKSLDVMFDSKFLLMLSFAFLLITLSINMLYKYFILRYTFVFISLIFSIIFRKKIFSLFCNIKRNSLF